MRLYKPPGVPIEAGTPGFNEWGVMLSAEAGARHDEHVWALVRARMPAVPGNEMRGVDIDAVHRNRKD